LEPKGERGIKTLGVLNRGGFPTNFDQGDPLGLEGSFKKQKVGGVEEDYEVKNLFKCQSILQAVA